MQNFSESQFQLIRLISTKKNTIQKGPVFSRAKMSTDGSDFISSYLKGQTLN